MTDLELGQALALEQWNEDSPLPTPHPHTVALAKAATNLRGLSPQQRMRLCWMAWITFSSHSTMRNAEHDLPQPVFAGLLLMSA